MNKYQSWILGSMLLLTASLHGQTEFKNWLKPREGFRIEPFLMTQTWATYSRDMEVYHPGNRAYEPVDDRLDIQFRRARLGFRAQPYERLKLTLVTAYDLVGRDLLSATMGGGNNESTPEFDLWDAYAEWKVSKHSEVANLTVGWFRPQFSRESITSGWSVNSMEKAMSQNYIRTQLVGSGPGRAMGVNLGGLWLQADKKMGLQYHLGLFTPQYIALGGNSVGRQFAPLLVGRVVGMLGDPEMEKYTMSYQINYFNERKGLSLGLSGAWQGETELFARNYALSPDLLFNWGPLNLDGEWNLMWRQAPAGGNGENAVDRTVHTGAGHLRAGINWIAGEKLFLEPTFMVVHFTGPLDVPGQAQAKNLGMSSGAEWTYDAGLNWYLNKTRLKVALHYTWYAGDAGDAAPGFTGNLYFKQSGIGAIRRGNWLGLGLTSIF